MHQNAPHRRKRRRALFALSSEHRGSSRATFQASDTKNNGQLRILYTAAFTFLLHQQRSEDVVSYYSMLQTGQDTQKTVCCSAAFHHYRGAYTRPFHDITLRLSQNQGYCTNIEEAQKGVVTQTVAFHTIVKLHFLRATDIVPYCATQ